MSATSWKRTELEGIGDMLMMLSAFSPILAPPGYRYDSALQPGSNGAVRRAAW